MFSYHLAELPAAVGIRAMWHPPSAGDVPGLRHGEALAFMQLASPTVSRQRMQVRRVAYFARWDDEEALDRFLTRHPLGTALADGWHVRMDFLRRFGALACFPAPGLIRIRHRDDVDFGRVGVHGVEAVTVISRSGVSDDRRLVPCAHVLYSLLMFCTPVVIECITCH